MQQFVHLLLDHESHCVDRHRTDEYCLESSCKYPVSLLALNTQKALPRIFILELPQGLGLEARLHEVDREGEQPPANPRHHTRPADLRLLPPVSFVGDPHEVPRPVVAAEVERHRNQLP